MSSFIRLEQVSKSFGPVTVVDKLDLDIAKGEFVSLLGPSGSGKTTILMMLAGFVTPTSGAIWLDGKRIERLPSHKRNIGVVFQNYALFPHMTVAENIAFPLEMRGTPKSETAERVARTLDMVKLGHLKGRKPAQLSGGQQQRVALSRALVFEPTIVLMDEPLGALDKQLREHMQLELRELHRRLGLTIVFVTHDQGEALTMSDRIAVFEAGKIEQIASPEEIYDHPRTKFVAEFFGETNLFRGTVSSIADDAAEVNLENGQFLRVDPKPDLKTGTPILVSIRPERVRLIEGGDTVNALPVSIADIVYQGDHLRVRAVGNGTELIAKLGPRDAKLAIGSRLHAAFEPRDCTLITP